MIQITDLLGLRESPLYRSSLSLTLAVHTSIARSGIKRVGSGIISQWIRDQQVFKGSAIDLLVREQMSLKEIPWEFREDFCRSV